MAAQAQQRRAEDQAAAAEAERASAARDAQRLKEANLRRETIAEICDCIENAVEAGYLTWGMEAMKKIVDCGGLKLDPPLDRRWGAAGGQMKGGRKGFEKLANEILGDQPVEALRDALVTWQQGNTLIVLNLETKTVCICCGE